MSRRPIFDLLEDRGLSLLRPARVTKTVAITVGAGALPVKVTAAPTQGYVGTNFSVYADWSGGPPNPPYDVLYEWGDGLTTKHTGIEPLNDNASHAYTTAKDTYTVKVTVTELITGSVGSGTVNLTVKAKLTADLSANPTTGPAPLAVTFTVNIQGGYVNYSYKLAFGDGTADASGTRSAAGSFTIEHSYSKTGSFTATLTVDDALGTSVMSTVSIGAGVLVLFPRLRERFPRIFGKIDEIRQKARERLPAEEGAHRPDLAVAE